MYASFTLYVYLMISVMCVFLFVCGCVCVRVSFDWNAISECNEIHGTAVCVLWINGESWNLKIQMERNCFVCICIYIEYWGVLLDRIPNSIVNAFLCRWVVIVFLRLFVQYIHRRCCCCCSFSVPFDAVINSFVFSLYLFRCCCLLLNDIVYCIFSFSS